MTKIKLGMEQSYCDIKRLYDTIAQVIGYEKTDDEAYDCNKVYVARNIQDNVMAYYDNERDLPEYDRAVLWACYGPKATGELEDDEVAIHDGFIASKK